MEQLGLPQLLCTVFGQSFPQQKMQNKKHNNDPDFDCNDEDETNSDEDLSDDILVRICMALGGKEWWHHRFKLLLLKLKSQFSLQVMLELLVLKLKSQSWLQVMLVLVILKMVLPSLPTLKKVCANYINKYLLKANAMPCTYH